MARSPVTGPRHIRQGGAGEPRPRRSGRAVSHVANRHPQTAGLNIDRHAPNSRAAPPPSPRASARRARAAGTRTLMTPGGPSGMRCSTSWATSRSPESVAALATIVPTPRPCAKSPSTSNRQAILAAPSASGSAPSRCFKSPASCGPRSGPAHYRPAAPRRSSPGGRPRPPRTARARSTSTAARHGYPSSVPPQARWPARASGKAGSHVLVSTAPIPAAVASASFVIADTVCRQPGHHRRDPMCPARVVHAGDGQLRLQRCAQRRVEIAEFIESAIGGVDGLHPSKQRSVRPGNFVCDLGTRPRVRGEREGVLEPTDRGVPTRRRAPQAHPPTSSLPGRAGRFDFEHVRRRRSTDPWVRTVRRRHARLPAGNESARRGRRGFRRSNATTLRTGRR